MADCLLVAGAVLLVACFAYALGRRAGYADGRKAVEGEAPVVVREAALRGGICPICGTRAKDILPAASVVAEPLISCE